MGDSRLFAPCALKNKWCQSLFPSPTSCILRPKADLWLTNYRSYSAMATSRDDSNQVSGTKPFRHAVDSSDDRAKE